ncbi:MAG: thioredoxin-dependent thiol peroxidase [Alloprevotella sp.]|nr:thioredoxin-dependent thiol peroxidase [Alloprevotella sp.]
MNIGDQAPDLLGLDEQGNELRLSQFRGQRVVLYFYPKDNTPGCTAEACSFRDHEAELAAAGYVVVGVSADSAQSHVRFRERHGLPFHLVADTERQLIEAFGAWGEKKMCGRTYMGILRTTFVIDEEGRIAHIFTPKQIKTKTHAEQVLALQ